VQLVWNSVVQFTAGIYCLAYRTENRRSGEAVNWMPYYDKIAVDRQTIEDVHGRRQ